MSPSLRASLVGALVLAGVTVAQTSDAQCLPAYSWMTNDRAQNPCLVEAYLQQQCVQGQGNWNVPALPPNLTYIGPSAAQSNVCQCSSVTYSLIAACAACQNATWIPWSRWRFNCTENVVNIARWPLDVPVGTSIPAWAYLDVTVNDTFTPSFAIQFQNEPESTRTGATTTTSSARTSIPATLTNSAASTTSGGSSADQTAGASSGGTNVGAIAGGVVGGVIAILLILGLIWWVYRKKNQGKGSPISPVQPYGAHQRVDMAESTIDPYSTTPAPISSYSYSPDPTAKLYDPSDPTTFPTSPSNGGYTASMTQMPTPSPNLPSMYGSPPPRTGGYSGAPEI